MSCPTAGWICSDVLLTSSANLRQMFCWLESHAQGGIKRVSASFRESTGSGYEDEWAAPAGAQSPGVRGRIEPRRHHARDFRRAELILQDVRYAAGLKGSLTWIEEPAHGTALAESVDRWF